MQESSYWDVIFDIFKFCLSYAWYIFDVFYCFKLSMFFSVCNNFYGCGATVFLVVLLVFLVLLYWYLFCSFCYFLRFLLVLFLLLLLIQFLRFSCSSLSVFNGIYIFCPSSTAYAKFTSFKSASSVIPPAASITSFILAVSFTLTIPSFFTAPVICIIIVPSSWFSFVSSSVCDILFSIFSS